MKKIRAKPKQSDINPLSNLYGDFDKLRKTFDKIGIDYKIICFRDLEGTNILRKAPMICDQGIELTGSVYFYFLNGLYKGREDIKL